MAHAEYPSVERRKQQGRNAVVAAVKSGRLIRPEACEYCGRIGQVHAHHDDYAKPLDVKWLCRQCHGAEHRNLDSWVAAAIELRRRGKTYDEIAELLGQSQGIVWRRLNPERAAENARRDNARRRSEKRRHERESKRRVENRGTCVECSRPMGIGVAHDGICSRCRRERHHISGGEIERARLVERWWAEGVSVSEIASRLGVSKGSLAGRMHRWRELGFHLPHRYNVRQR